MNLRRSHGTGSYLARYTTRPHEDIERGWTAAIGCYRVLVTAIVDEMRRVEGATRGDAA